MGMDMDKLLQQVGQMQSEMQKAQEELANETVQATAGGGMVTVVANGAGEIKEIKIDPKAIDPDDPEMLEDMVLAAVNEAVRSAQSLMESKLGGLAGGWAVSASPDWAGDARPVERTAALRRPGRRAARAVGRGDFGVRCTCRAGPDRARQAGRGNLRARAGAGHRRSPGRPARDRAGRRFRGAVAPGRPHRA